ncbi:acyltransferase family protein [Mucilaginibacter flavus]|uniref:acyltransferase family protein n=1 Tax=Mucilaginibacter flavus TaxID=931504 RepID=UPI0025B4AE64|nr:acyltransferase [Mucilaginibacter flavus]MDN3584418.1 acyltransferase [Mucilaginibacter flavus]
MTKAKNGFDLLRILLAAMVVLEHSLLIGGYDLKDPLYVFSKGQINFADLGVMVFFALSGYLITASFERSGNVFIFASHRLLRIFPGFWVCLIVAAFLISPLIFISTGRSWSAFDFFGPGGALNFIKQNFFLKINQWSIKSLLDHAAYQESLNGSLWSLFPEMQCYCFTLSAGLFGLFKRNKFLYLLISMIVFAYFAINVNFSKSFGPTLLTLSPALKLYASYLAGSVIYLFRDFVTPDKKGTLFLLLFTLILIRFGGFNLVSPFLIALVLINLFQLFEFKIKYDVSYGMYIYSFPIQQLLFHIFGNKLHVLAFISMALFFSAIAGFLSYIWIERPFMNLRNKTDQLLK